MPAQSIYDDVKRVFHYPCPCGDRFEISRRQLRDAEDLARCPSCSLVIRIVYDPLDFEDDEDEDDAATAVGTEAAKSATSTTSQPVAVSA